MALTTLPHWLGLLPEQKPPYFVLNPIYDFHLGSQACLTCPSHPACSFAGTEAQPAAPANAFGSQQAKSNPAQLSLLRLPPALPVPCTRMCIYSCHPAWAPGAGGEGPGSGHLFTQAFSAPALHSGWSLRSMARSVCGRRSGDTGRRDGGPSFIGLGTARKKEPQFPGPAPCWPWSGTKNYKMEPLASCPHCP